MHDFALTLIPTLGHQRKIFHYRIRILLVCTGPYYTGSRYHHLVMQSGNTRWGVRLLVLGSGDSNSRNSFQNVPLNTPGLTDSDSWRCQVTVTAVTIWKRPKLNFFRKTEKTWNLGFFDWSFWVVRRITFVLAFAFLSQNFGKVAMTYEWYYVSLWM